MKTIIISAIPYVKSGLGLFLPIGTLSIASTLSYNGYDVCFIDVSTNHNWEQELRNTLKSDTISAVVFATYTSSAIKIAIQIIDIIRKHDKQIPNYLGWLSCLCDLAEYVRGKTCRHCCEICGRDPNIKNHSPVTGIF